MYHPRNLFDACVINSKSVHNYAKQQRSHANFGCQENHCRRTNDSQGRSASFTIEQRGERKSEQNWLMTNAIGHR